MSDAGANPTGSYRPTNYGTGDTFAAPAPTAPYLSPATAGTDTLISAFGAGDPNGTWSLYAVDDAAGITGTVAGGWSITFSRTTYSCGPVGPVSDAIADFDGDDKTDASIYRSGTWWINNSGGGTSIVPFGAAGDTLVTGDYDGDRKADVAVFRGGNWYILNSGNGNVQIFGWGLGSDTPVQGDYDGDGDTDPAVYRNGTWYVRNSSGGILLGASWGVAGDVPVVGVLPTYLIRAQPTTS
jgi:hypothetical protein